MRDLYNLTPYPMRIGTILLESLESTSEGSRYLSRWLSCTGMATLCCGWIFAQHCLDIARVLYCWWFRFKTVTSERSVTFMLFPKRGVKPASARRLGLLSSRLMSCVLSANHWLTVQGYPNQPALLEDVPLIVRQILWFLQKKLQHTFGENIRQWLKVTHIAKWSHVKGRLHGHVLHRI
jgi:hypothetical protein